MNHPWWEQWLEHKNQYARMAEAPFIDKDVFNSVTVGTGLPDISFRSTFAFKSAREGARRFRGISMDGEKPHSRIYTRLGHPNLEYLENVLLRLDCAHILARAEAAGEKEDVVQARVFSSGLTAISMSLMALTEPGDEILVGRTLYGGTVGMLKTFEKKFKVRVHYVDTTDTAKFKSALDGVKNPACVFLESPDNPTLVLSDIRAIADLTEARGIPLLVDNTFLTPYLQQPMRLGADIAIQSMTKYISGHSTCIGGVVVGPHGFVQNELYPLFRDFGAVPSPFDSWLTSLTVQTLGIRMEAQVRNAVAVARFLEGHPKVMRVHYPGLESHPQRELVVRQMRSGGAMIAFELKGGFEPARKLMDYLAGHDKPMELAVSLGCVITYIQHPASMTHAGVPREERLKGGTIDELVRLSVGIEGTDTLLQALEEGLEIAYRQKRKLPPPQEEGRIQPPGNTGVSR